MSDCLEKVGLLICCEISGVVLGHFEIQQKSDMIRTIDLHGKSHPINCN